MLDEPSRAPRLVREVTETIQRINTEGMTALFIEQAFHQSLEKTGGPDSGTAPGTVGRSLPPAWRPPPAIPRAAWRDRLRDRQGRMNGNNLRASFEMRQHRENRSTGQLMKREPSGSDDHRTAGQPNAKQLPFAVAIGHDADLPAREGPLPGGVEAGHLRQS
jgi:hypothetical protein